MRFFFSPFIFVYELIAFLIQAAVLYGFALIIVFGLILHGISSMQKETIIEREIVHTETKIINNVPVNPTRGWNERICKRIEGCEVNFRAKTPEEYCPTCVWSKDWNWNKKSKSSEMFSSSDEPPVATKTW